ncbi:hypothetical protein EK21DRAFT_116317 [Setomelanomma holmii]|uniref:Uncharacterized protein n=1 Tax=Setomelanomma holmii TaxID=210430 RepID=A0A9P4LGR1_9PLEO|nr:hypothetical protein EK21DRAFT_116317 [Setomelanomma holmii]
MSSQSLRLPRELRDKVYEHLITTVQRRVPIMPIVLYYNTVAVPLPLLQVSYQIREAKDALRRSRDSLQATLLLDLADAIPGVVSQLSTWYDLKLILRCINRHISSDRQRKGNANPSDVPVIIDPNTNHVRPCIYTDWISTLLTTVIFPIHALAHDPCEPAESGRDLNTSDDGHVPCPRSRPQLEQASAAAVSTVPTGSSATLVHNDLVRVQKLEQALLALEEQLFRQRRCQENSDRSMRELRQDNQEKAAHIQRQSEVFQNTRIQ